MERALASNFTACVLRTSLLIEVIPLQSGNRPPVPSTALGDYSRNKLPFKLGCQLRSGGSGNLWSWATCLQRPRTEDTGEFPALGQGERSQGGRGTGGRASAPPWVSLTAHLPREAQAPRTPASMLPEGHYPLPSVPQPTVLGVSGSRRISFHGRAVSRPGGWFSFRSWGLSAFQSQNPRHGPFFIRFPLQILLSLTVSPPSKPRGGVPVPTGRAFDLDEALCAQRRKKHSLPPSTRLCIHSAQIDSRSSCSQWTPAGEKRPYIALVRERTSGTNPLPRLCPLSCLVFAIPA